MSANEQYDVLLGGQGYMLARDPKTRGRAWQRTGVVDSLSTQRRVFRSLYGDEESYGGLPAELDAPEVFGDWSSGYGEYRQKSRNSNHHHVAFNFDTRFPRTLFHAQAPQMLAAQVIGSTGGAFASACVNADFFMDVPLPGIANPPVGAGAVLVLGNNYVARFTPTKNQYQYGGGIANAANASTFDYAGEGPANSYGHRPQVFGSFSYLPTLTGSGFVQRGHDGTTYTQSALPARWFQVAAGRLWRGHSRSLIQSIAIGADPMVPANWSATLSLGDGFLQTDDAQTFEANLFVGFPDGLYQGNVTGTFNNILSDIGEYIHPDNVRDISVHGGGLVAAEGAHIWHYKPAVGANSTLRQIWPYVDVRAAATLGIIPVNNRGLNFRGQITCLKGFGQWLYAGMFNGSQSMVYCGIDASAPLPYVWHPMQLFNETCKISRIHVDGITAASDNTRIPRRIWVATDASWGAAFGTAPIYFWQIPQGDEQPFADVSFSPNYTAQAYVEQPITDWQAPGTWKLWRKIETYSETLGSAVIPAQLSLILDGSINAGFVSGGNQVTTAPKFTSYLSNNNAGAIGQAGALQVLSTVPSGGPTPIYRAFVIRGSERPRSNDTITMKLTVADGMHDRQGGLMRDAQTQMAELRGFLTSASPTVLVDLTGATIPVLVLPPVDETEQYQAASDNPNLLAVVRVGVLDASWNTFTPTPFGPRGG